MSASAVESRPSEALAERRPRRLAPPWWLLVVAWCALMGGGFAWVLAYASTPGPSGVAPPSWPEATALAPRRADAWTLVLFAHPHCPCTRATLDALAKTTARAGGTVDARMVLVRDRSTTAGWERGELLTKARRIPGLSVDVDVGGVEAGRFGARSSGHVFLFDPAGRVRFSGGVTALRGHAGAAAGAAAVDALLAGEASSTSETPVYGCPLLEEACVEEEAPCTR